MLRSSALKRNKPMRTGSRNAVARGIKRKADEQAYWNTLADVCDGCGRHGGTVPHHILANAPGKGKRRDHMLVVKLCAGCHNMDTHSVHLLGSEAAFHRVTGVDLVAIAVERRDEYLMSEIF